MIKPTLSQGSNKIGMNFAVWFSTDVFSSSRLSDARLIRGGSFKKLLNEYS